MDSFGSVVPCFLGAIHLHAATGLANMDFLSVTTREWGGICRSHVCLSNNLRSHTCRMDLYEDSF